ncbi:restriction endonuclease subunit S [Vibrio alginolyticus]|uniref:restriction endonuclease subunit S n=1 Tax=Vibrio TaxID=662 RepID=UPI00116D0341|nr:MULTISPECIES: restriction endonuclease subunit S [Vibrio]MDW1500178.1 restriction endonuclease subunit S [Vibrio sp. YT-19(2023)]TOK06203.1 restriction endonuclease [Vibrio parahaemolyticus]TOM37080.1 restriction endonuclease [Vibrio parahaemolyticus]
MSFETATLDSLCELVVDCPHSTPKWTDEGIIVLRNQNIKNGVLDLSAPSFTNEEDYQKRIKRAAPKAGDIVFTREAPMGEVCMIPEGLKCCLGQRQVLLRPKSDVNGQYLFWALQSPYVQQQIAWNEGTGSTVSNVRIPVLKALNIPRIGNEDMVAKSLSDIASKMALNTQTNQTLEQMAQAIFKSWFVDFDPVKAKMNGELPEGMDAATASLFPEKLVESELGLIPEGWKVSSLSELIKLTGGGTPKRSEETYWNGDIPWFSVKDVPSGSNVFVVDTDEKITELGLNKSSTKLLPKGTTIITARGTVGKLALVGTDMCMNQSCYGIRGKEVGDYYNYFNLKEAVSTLQRNTHGAVFDTITTKTFDTYSLAFGGVELANRFDDVIAPLLQKIESNVRQNIELSALRDTLLPKLLSGEVEFNEV